MQDVVHITMMQDGVYVSGELWEYLRDTFPRPLVCDMWHFLMNNIDDDRAKFVTSLAWRGPRSLV
jgi:hypothetical protein